MSWYITMDENYINSLKQQLKNIEEQNNLLEDLFNDYLLEKQKISYCKSLKIYIKEYYENVLHKLGYGKTKEE